MADGYVQVATDGTGKKIDNAALLREPETQGGTGETVYRQRVAIASDTNPRLQAEVSGEVGGGELEVTAKALGEILVVLTEIRDMLQVTIGN